MENIATRPRTSGDSGVSSLLDTVVAGGYCVGCGACAAVEGSPLRMELDDHRRLVAAQAGPVGDLRGAAVDDVCPFSDAAPNEDELARAAVDLSCEYHDRIGYHLATYVGHVTEQDFRARGSSGGMGSWTLCELLSRGMVDAVLHVQPRVGVGGEDPLFAFEISRTPDQVRAGGKSRYYPITMSEVVREVRQTPGRYAMVGTPCFVKAARLLCRTDPVVAERLVYFVGLVCGHLKSTRFADMFAWQMGVKPGELGEIDFRHKLPLRMAWDYGVRVRGRSDSQGRVRAASTMYGYDWDWGFFKYKACDYCDDVLAETADVTVGDAWLHPYDSDTEGTNVVVVRNRALLGIIDEARGAGRLHLDPLSPGDVARSQKAGLHHRREGLAYRLHLRDRAGEWRPRKRVAASAKHLSSVRREIHRAREAVAERSHIAFAEARDFSQFEKAMEPLVSELRSLHQVEQMASRAKPAAWRRSMRLLQRAIERSWKQPAPPQSFPLARVRPDWEILQGRKNLYLMQPTWPNMGDQAQCIATEAWLWKYYREAPLVALDVRDTHDLLPELARLVTPDDIVFIQSGGNLGDHWISQENLRRDLIQAFPNNQVVVLSNTIFFSNTKKGQQELETSRRIYGSHPRLTVMARDPVSYAQALAIFSRAQVLCVPDFVLSLSHPEPEQTQPNTADETRTLLLLRDDHESTFTEEDEKRLLQIVPGVVTRLDTNVDEEVHRYNRKEVLRKLLDVYHEHDLVVTNRLHGAIFAVLCRRPCVVLPTIDHKLTSAAYWLRDVAFLKVSSGIDSVPRKIEEVHAVENREVPDYPALYFEPLPEFIATGRTGAPFDGAGWDFG